MIAVLIHAHKNAAQVEMLVNTLQHPEIKIFIHIDKKSRLVIKNSNITVISYPLSVEWGSFSQVKALLHSLQQIKTSGVEYDFIHFISGQDFPIKPVSSFVSFLAVNKQKSFVQYKKIDTEWPEAKVRYQRFYFTQSKLLNSIARPISKLMSIIYKRKPPLEMFGGSQWTTLSNEAVDIILENGSNQTPLFNFFKYCDVSDEMFVQTILLNSPLKNSCINNNLRFIKWSAASNSPDVLTVRDFEAIKNTPAFFARKFDTSKDTAVLDRICSELL